MTAERTTEQILSEIQWQLFTIVVFLAFIGIGVWIE